MLLTLETLAELYSGYNPLNDTERFNHIYDYVRTIYELEDKDSSFPFGLLLIAAITEGTKPNTLAHFCRMPLDFVTEVADRLTASGLWLDDGSVDYDFLTAVPGLDWDVCFSVDLLVAEGELHGLEGGETVKGYISSPRLAYGTAQTTLLGTRPSSGEGCANQAPQTMTRTEASNQGASVPGWGWTAQAVHIARRDCSGPAHAVIALGDCGGAAGEGSLRHPDMSAHPRLSRGVGDSRWNVQTR